MGEIGGEEEYRGEGRARANEFVESWSIVAVVCVCVSCSKVVMRQRGRNGDQRRDVDINSFFFLLNGCRLSYHLHCFCCCNTCGSVEIAVAMIFVVITAAVGLLQSVTCISLSLSLAASPHFLVFRSVHYALSHRLSRRFSLKLLLLTWRNSSYMAMARQNVLLISPRLIYPHTNQHICTSFRMPTSVSLNCLALPQSQHTSSHMLIHTHIFKSAPHRRVSHLVSQQRLTHKSY